MDCTVSELLDRISSRELTEQSEYDRLEPFSEAEKVQQQQLATIACILANANRDEKKHPKPFEIGEFMPKYGNADAEREQEAPKKQTSEEQLAMVIMFNAAMGGMPLRNEDKLL